MDTDFTFLITLPAWKARIVAKELSKKGIHSKITDHGTNISWNQLRGGGSSPEIFMPAFPRDISVPKNRSQESKAILEHLGYTENEIVFPKVRRWQKILAVIAILIFIFYAISIVIIMFQNN